jgi:hypothetical protein
MDDKKVDLVTSEATLWEINDELKRRLVERSYRLLARAQIIRWYELAGMHSYGDRHGWISTFCCAATCHVWALSRY